VELEVGMEVQNQTMFMVQEEAAFPKKIAVFCLTLSMDDTTIA